MCEQKQKRKRTAKDLIIYLMLFNLSLRLSTKIKWEKLKQKAKPKRSRWSFKRVRVRAQHIVGRPSAVLTLDTIVTSSCCFPFFSLCSLCLQLFFDFGFVFVFFLLLSLNELRFDFCVVLINANCFIYWVKLLLCIVWH